ncbi:MAG: hypothetical protein IPP79_10515 [Chitinophagaceae bacterium]|nr:hypothetical protein [Chitinophagaceae bacterium]
MKTHSNISKDSADTRLVIWFSRILRWGLGAFFTGAGIIYFKEGAWPAIAFGAIIFATGFLRPKRCLDETCSVSQDK